MRFYRPGVIAVYCALSLPVGLCLYGLNVARRGSRVIGYTILGTSLVALVGIVLVGILGGRVSRIGLLSIILAIGLQKMEVGPYQQALSRGGRTARWWPPLLWILGALIVALMIWAIFVPDEIGK